MGQYVGLPSIFFSPIQTFNAFPTQRLLITIYDGFVSIFIIFCKTNLFHMSFIGHRLRSSMQLLLAIIYNGCDVNGCVCVRSFTEEFKKKKKEPHQIRVGIIKIHSAREHTFLNMLSIRKHDSLFYFSFDLTNRCNYNRAHSKQ